MAVERKYERDIDLFLAEEFSVSQPFATWFLNQTKGFKDVNAKVAKVYVSRSDATGESDLVVIYERLNGDGRFALHIEDKIDAPLQPEQEVRYRLRAEGQGHPSRLNYSEFEVILCSPKSYSLVHEGAVTFDALVTYEAISDFLKSRDPEDPRSLYRADFVATAAMKTANAWAPSNDAVTTAFWIAAFQIAIADFPDLEMKQPVMTKGQTWLIVRPLDMPTQPRYIYIALKGDRGFIDLTFSACLTRLFQPQVKSFLNSTMSVHQTGKATAIRIVVKPFEICEPDDAVLARVRAAFSACVDLIQFYRKHRESLNHAAATSLPSDF